MDLGDCSVFYAVRVCVPSSSSLPSRCILQSYTYTIMLWSCSLLVAEHAFFPIVLLFLGDSESIVYSMVYSFMTLIWLVRSVRCFVLM